MRHRRLGRTGLMISEVVLDGDLADEHGVQPWGGPGVRFIFVGRFFRALGIDAFIQSFLRTQESRNRRTWRIMDNGCSLWRE